MHQVRGLDSDIRTSNNCNMSQATNVESLFSVKGTVSVITGGGSGLGATIALALDVSIL